MRLADPAAFERVFSSATVRLRSGPLRLLAIRRDLGRQDDARLSGPDARLGLVVGKRALRRASDRNRVKRILRERFRRQRHAFADFDVVIQLTRSPEHGEIAAGAESLFRQLADRK
ncbi:MAG: ribonuclease P protein component [Gammaproteobacteria bacterium]